MNPGPTCDYDDTEPATGQAVTENGGVLAYYCKAHAEKAYDEFGEDRLVEWRPVSSHA
jgi:hypothetical protein